MDHDLLPRTECLFSPGQRATSSSGPSGEAPKCTNSSAESSCTNKSASSFKNSSQGCKLTNLQAAAASATQFPPFECTPQLDNSLTEHSMDNDKMHVAPLEVPFRTNMHPGRHHKNRSKGTGPADSRSSENMPTMSPQCGRQCAEWPAEKSAGQ